VIPLPVFLYLKFDNLPDLKLLPRFDLGYAACLQIRHLKFSRNFRFFVVFCLSNLLYFDLNPSNSTRHFSKPAQISLKFNRPLAKILQI